MRDILQYYETELDYMQRSFEAFEKAHPQAAHTLGISAGKSDDPDIQRLSDSMALLAARLSKRLDETIPEIALDITRVICPVFLLGTPSYCPVQLTKGTGALGEKTQVKKGTELIFLSGDEKPLCKFVAACSMDIAPLVVTDAKLETAPFPFQGPQDFTNIDTALTLNLSCEDPETLLGEMGMDTLSFYVCAPAGRKRRLVDALAGEVKAFGVGLDKGHQTHWLDCKALKLTLVESYSTFLPTTATTPPGIASLRDFLSYPDQASYFEVSGLGPILAKHPANEISLRFFIGANMAKHLGEVQTSDFALNVIPLVNCYPDKSRPLRYDFAREQIPLFPSSADEMDVVSLQLDGIDKLTPEGPIPLPSITTADRKRKPDLVLWQERHTSAEFDRTRRAVSFSMPTNNNRGNNAVPEPIDIIGSLLCSNGLQASRPRPGSKVSFSSDTLSEIPFTVLAEPSSPVLPEYDPQQLWQLLALINANFSSIFDAPDPRQALKDALHICSPAGYSEAANALWEVTVTRSIAPISIGKSVLLAAGSNIEVVLDLAPLPYAPHVFAVVLNRFFRTFVSYDRFFQLTVRERGQNQPLHVFPKTHGGTLCG
ncbi:type VI secretion system baseplate subunit TssF [Flexibacterium corallicola]|uniref:type VI secretion system baseplate subunit TssF n=1 Tax=Flexibacterium corallicola TaxID=3037259 RepID=UPI00286EF26A|nr:type VI secretion system baseplate subunit TssF [Pseudovibrio sp. M1P-2-3]